MSPDPASDRAQPETQCSAGSAPSWKRVLHQTAADVLQHKKQGNFPLATDVMTLPADTYTCPERFERERRNIFRRLPLLLAASCELPAIGDFKTMQVAGVPVLLTRGRDGCARAYLNSCTHRGANVASGCGNTRRFVCPSGGWRRPRSNWQPSSASGYERLPAASPQSLPTTGTSHTTATTGKNWPPACSARSSASRCRPSLILQAGL